MDNNGFSKNDPIVLLSSDETNSKDLVFHSFGSEEEGVGMIFKLKLIIYFFVIIFVVVPMHSFGGTFNEYFQQAKDGNIESQYTVAMMYYKGEGIYQDFNEALKWFRKAAGNGSIDAWYMLGVVYFNGEGVSQSFKQAEKWYRKAAEFGNVLAQNNLGMMYVEGQGVSQDYKEAAYWYRKAIEQGDARAKFNLNVLFQKGLIPKDNKKPTINPTNR